MDYETAKLIAAISALFLAVIVLAVLCNRWEKKLSRWEDNIKDVEK